MKAFRYFIAPVVLISGLISQVYASTPAYVNSYILNAPESGFKSFLKAIYYIIMFALILAAAYYVTKFLAKRGIAQGRTKTMKLMESMPLGVDKSLQIVKVGSQFFLIGSTAKNMFLISELDGDKLLLNVQDGSFDLSGIEIESYEDGIETKDFSDYLDSVKQNLYKLKSLVRGKNGDE